MTSMEIQTEALCRATTNQSVSNYPAIYEGFREKGIAEDNILPRENVFTFNAWKALGRVVKKGEHGVKVTTWISVPTKQNGDGSVKPGYKTCRTTTVFHVSQTKLLTE